MIFGSEALVNGGKKEPVCRELVLISKTFPAHWPRIDYLGYLAFTNCPRVTPSWLVAFRLFHTCVPEISPRSARL